MLGGDAKPTRAPRETRKRNSVAKERVERDEEDLVRLYLTDIGQYPLLTKDDEVRLAQAIEGGNAARCELEKAASISASKKRELRRSVTEGEQAQRTFVQSNLRLVVSIAKKYQASGLPLLDLIQEGNLGLMHAVEKFDWRKGFKFSTYATWWIRQAITRGIANTGRTIRLPVHAGDTLARLQKARARLELVRRDAERLRELVRIGLRPVALEALPLAAQPIEAALLGARGAEAHHRPAATDVLLDVRADPPHRVRRQADAARWIEAVDRDEEAEVALLDQVEQPHAVRPILERDLDDEAKVPRHEPIGGVVIAESSPAKRQPSLLLGRQQVILIDAVEVRA